MDETRLGDKRYRLKQTKEDYQNLNKEFQKTKETTKLQKKNQYKIIKKVLIGKQNESNKEIKQNERKQKRGNIVDEDVDLGNFFVLAKINKLFVNGLNLHEIKNKILLDFKGDFEFEGLMVIRPVEQKTNIRFKNMDDFLKMQ